MLNAMQRLFGIKTATPRELSTRREAIVQIRNAFEHIEDRAFGKAYGKPDGNALSIFDQPDFISNAVLRYRQHTLALRTDVVPILISARRFILDVAVEKQGSTRYNDLDRRSGRSSWDLRANSRKRLLPVAKSNGSEVVGCGFQLVRGGAIRQ